MTSFADLIKGIEDRVGGLASAKVDCLNGITTIECITHDMFHLSFNLINAEENVNNSMWQEMAINRAVFKVEDARKKKEEEDSKELREREQVGVVSGTEKETSSKEQG